MSLAFSFSDSVVWTGVTAFVLPSLSLSLYLSLSLSLSLPLQLVLSTPVLASPDHTFSLSGFASDKDCTGFASSYERAQGGRAALTVSVSSRFVLALFLCLYILSVVC